MPRRPSWAPRPHDRDERRRERYGAVGDPSNFRVGAVRRRWRPSRPPRDGVSRRRNVVLGLGAAPTKNEHATVGRRDRQMPSPRLLHRRQLE